MGELQRKMKHEYEIFCLDMTRTSRANIFANSREIEIKKSIFLYFSREKITAKQKEYLLACDNILETAYRYVLDYENTCANGKKINVLCKEWISLLCV